MKLCCIAFLSLAAAAPSTMKAGALTKKTIDFKVHLENVNEVQVNVPTPASGEVLVQVAGSSVNPVDWKLIEYASATWTVPHVFGRDFAGKVVAIGAGVTNFKVGDNVWGDNSQHEGAFAEYVAVDQSIVGHAPSKISLAESATLPLVALTGLEAFHFAQAPWAPGKTVVVLGGSGGVGHASIQLAKALGASSVITTCGTSHVDFCTSLGADLVIDYHKSNFHDVIPKQSVDVVFDTVGIAGTGDLAYDLLKDGGSFATLLSRGVASKAVASKRPSIKQETFMLSQIQTSYLDTLKNFIDAGKLRSHIEKTFTISQTAAAFNASMAGHTAGKISVVPDGAQVIV